MFVKALVTMDLHHLEINVLVAQLDVFNAHRISFAFTVLIICLYTKEAVSTSALLELLEIDQVEIGNVFLVTLHAKPVWIILLTAQVAKMEKDIYKLQLFNNPVSLNVLMELMLKTVFVKFVISLVLLASELLVIVSHAPMDKPFTTEDAGPNALQFWSQVQVQIYVFKTVLMDFIKYQSQNAHLALLNVQLVATLQQIVLHASMDQLLLLEHAVLNVDKIKWVSVEFA